MMEMTKKRITMMKTTITAQGASLRVISADVVRRAAKLDRVSNVAFF